MTGTDTSAAGEERWLLPEGIEELLPPQAARVERLRRELLDLYARWGYELVIPPLMEFTDSLLIGLGKDLDLQTFTLTDQLSGRLLGIRPDITAQAARIDAHSLRRDGPMRLCYAGSVRTAGLGPVIGYIQPFSKTESLVLEFKWLFEMDVKNRLDGDYIWLKAVYKF